MEIQIMCSLRPAFLQGMHNCNKISTKEFERSARIFFFSCTFLFSLLQGIFLCIFYFRFWLVVDGGRWEKKLKWVTFRLDLHFSLGLWIEILVVVVVFVFSLLLLHRPHHLLPQRKKVFSEQDFKSSWVKEISISTERSKNRLLFVHKASSIKDKKCWFLCCSSFIVFHRV